MARILKYDELKRSGYGYLELLDCTDPIGSATTVPCAWIDPKTVVCDCSRFPGWNSKQEKYRVYERLEDEYNCINRYTVVAWRIWDEMPSTTEMFNSGWIETFKRAQPLYFRSE